MKTIKKIITEEVAAIAINNLASLIEADKRSEEKLSKDLVEAFETAICCLDYTARNVLNENDIYATLELEAIERLTLVQD